MLKVMGLLQRKPGMQLDAFRLHWRTIHRDLALRLAHAGIIRGYVQNHRLAIDVDGLVPFADGVPELWFDDALSLDRMRDSPAYRDGAFHDGPRFMDVENYDSILLQPEPEIAAPPRTECAGLLKAMFILETAAPEDIEEPRSSMIMGEISPVRLSYHRVADEKTAISTRPCVAVETSWWNDLPSFLEAWAHRSVSKAPGILIEERPVFWPGERPPPADWSPVSASARQPN